MSTVAFYPEEIDALASALESLHAEREALERRDVHSVELGTDIERVESLRDRMLAEHNGLRDRLAAHPGFPLRRAS